MQYFHSGVNRLLQQSGEAYLKTMRQAAADAGSDDAFMQSRAGRPNIGPYMLLLHMPETAQRLKPRRMRRKKPDDVGKRDEGQHALGRDLDCGAGARRARRSPTTRCA